MERSNAWQPSLRRPTRGCMRVPWSLMGPRFLAFALLPLARSITLITECARPKAGDSDLWVMYAYSLLPYGCPR